MTMNTKQKKIVSISGTLLIAVSLIFIVNRFRSVEIDFNILTTPRVLFGLIALIFLHSFYFILTAINYHAWVFNASGKRMSLPAVLTVYCSANLFKYIPGGILTLAGRNRLAVDFDELIHGEVAAATTFEAIFFGVSTVVISFLFAFEYAIAEIRRVAFLPLIIITEVAVLTAAIIILYSLRNRFKKLLSLFNMFNALKPVVIIKRMGAALFFSVVWGMVFMLILLIMGQPMSLGFALTIIGLFNLAWLAGLLVPIAPAGLGVREAAIIMFMGGMVFEEYLLLAIMGHRIVVITGDIFAYLFALFMARMKNTF